MTCEILQQFRYHIWYFVKNSGPSIMKLVSMLWLVLYPYLLVGYITTSFLPWEYTECYSWRSMDHNKIQVRADLKANILLPISNSWRHQSSGHYNNIGGYGYNKRNRQQGLPNSLHQMLTKIYFFHSNISLCFLKLLYSGP